MIFSDYQRSPLRINFGTTLFNIFIKVLGTKAGVR